MLKDDPLSSVTTRILRLSVSAMVAPATTTLVKEVDVDPARCLVEITMASDLSRNFTSQSLVNNEWTVVKQSCSLAC